MNIYLSGLIGAGKTTVGRELAARLGWEFDDLDLAMAALTGKPYHAVVQDEGWLAFRQYEYQICKQFARRERAVIALGGGTVRYEWNRDVLAGSGLNILLIADLEVLADRVRPQDRPRVHAGTSLAEDLLTIWYEHQELYLSFADLTYHTDQGRTISEQIDDLVEELKLFGIEPNSQPGTLDARTPPRR
jgi:shikimate kinase